MCMAGGDVWMRGQIGGSFSHESEYDLALMVTDFWENGSAGAESWCSSDSDSALSDLAHLADKIPVRLIFINLFYKFLNFKVVTNYFLLIGYFD